MGLPEFIPSLFIAILATMALITLLFISLSVRSFRKRRWQQGSINLILLILSSSVTAVVTLMGMNLYSYNQLTTETPVAEIRVTQLQPQSYQVAIQRTDYDQDATLTPERQYLVHGDEWQLDARILKWQGLLSALGLDNVYRFERLSGRYQSVQDEQDKPRSVHDLGENQRGLDLWQLAADYSLGWIDTEYGSATYLPMREGALYTVMMTSTGLIARPANTIAEQAIAEW